MSILKKLFHPLLKSVADAEPGDYDYVTYTLREETARKQAEAMFEKMKSFDIFDIAEYLAVPNADDGHEFTNIYRLVNISHLLRDSEYCEIMAGHPYVVYGKKKFAGNALEKLPKDITLISSHVDCLQLNPSYEDRGELIHGIFDNSITNTSAVWLMRKGGLPDNVIFAFTGNEEKGARGAIELGNDLKKAGKNVKVAVLDVTYTGWDCEADFAIENNFWRGEEGHAWGRRIIETAKASGKNWIFVSSKSDESKGFLDGSLIGNEVPRERLAWGSEPNGASGEDESWAFAKIDSDDEYLNVGLNTFALCIPCSAATYEEMHCEGGFDIRKNELINYTEFARQIAEL